MCNNVVLSFGRATAKGVSFFDMRVALIYFKIITIFGMGPV
jgi:hypothetical protein